MPLDAEILGQALYDAREPFNKRTPQNLLDEYGTWEAVRLAAAKVDAHAIIDHFKNNAVIPGTGLVAPDGAVTGQTTIT